MNYLKHDLNAADDPKIIRLIRVMGPEGYGLFWLIIEFLRKQKDYRCEYSAEIIEDLAFQFHISKEKLVAVISNFNLFKIENGFFFSERLVADAVDYEENKNKISQQKRQAALSRWNARALQVHNTCNTDAMQNDANINKYNINKTNIIDGNTPALSQIIDIKQSITNLNLTDEQKKERLMIVTNELQKDTTIIQMCRSSHLTKEIVEKKLQQFIRDLEATEEYLNKIFDIKKHFLNILKINK